MKEQRLTTKEEQEQKDNRKSDNSDVRAGRFGRAKNKHPDVFRLGSFYACFYGFLFCDDEEEDIIFARGLWRFLTLNAFS